MAPSARNPSRTWPLTSQAALAWSLVLAALLSSLFILRGLTARAMLHVRQAGQAVDVVAEVRDLHAPLMRLLAYAQLVYQGDRSFQEALAQQNDLVDQAFDRLGQQVGTMAPSQWSLFKQAQADWLETRGALRDLIPANDLAMEQRLTLRETLRSRSGSLQRTLESLERESQEQRAALGAVAARWSARVDHTAAALMVLWLVAALLLWLGARQRILGPLAQLAAGADALTRGDLSFRMQRQPGDGAEALVASFNAMAESLQRSQERLAEPREITRS